MPEPYFIYADRYKIQGTMLQCKCGKKILVEMTFIGVPHHINMIVLCAECVEVPPEFKQVDPAAAARIEEWKKDA